MKFVGAVLIIAAFFLTGFSKNRKLYARCILWSNFIEGLGILESEICFSGTELKKAFKRTGSICEAKVFSLAAEELNKYGIDKAWENAVEKSDVNIKDRTIMLKLSSKIGKTDIKGQQKHIEYICSLADAARISAEKEYNEKGRLLCRGSVLLGLLVAVILM